MEKLPQILIVISSLVVGGQIRLLIFNNFQMSQNDWFVLIIFGILFTYYSVLYFVFNIKIYYTSETQKKEIKTKKIGFK